MEYHYYYMISTYISATTTTTPQLQSVFILKMTLFLVTNPSSVYVYLLQTQIFDHLYLINNSCHSEGREIFQPLFLIFLRREVQVEIDTIPRSAFRTILHQTKITVSQLNPVCAPTGTQAAQSAHISTTGIWRSDAAASARPTGSGPRRCKGATSVMRGRTSIGGHVD